MKTLLVILILAALAATASAGSSVKAPSGDCTWETNGQVIDGKLCHCERVKYPDGTAEVWCSWISAAKKPAKVKRPVKRIARVEARYGVGGGVLSHA